MTWFLLGLGLAVIVALVSVIFMPADDAASSTFAVRFPALAFEFGQANTAVRRYKQLLARGTPPDEAAAAIFRSHYEKRDHLNTTRKAERPGSLIREVASRKKSPIPGRHLPAINAKT